MAFRPDHSCKGAASIGSGAVGAGLKHEHAAEIFGGVRRVDFFEIHAENYMGAGGPPHHLLHRIRQDYPISLHGVGLSIGGAGPLNSQHLRRLQNLVETYQPALFSEHLAWSSHDGVFLNDLLPLPYNETTLAHVCSHIDDVQDALGMRMLLENPSTYVAFATSTMSEIDFLRAVVKRTGCGLLLDVNNVYVSAVNSGFDAEAYIDAFPVGHVGEFHLAGFAEDQDSSGARLLIDAHGCPVNERVWRLYRRALGRACHAPTLIEWDNDVPAFSVVAAEVNRARDILAVRDNAAGTMAAA
jgi:uncharacterized protein (UPF0276 family)